MEIAGSTEQGSMVMRDRCYLEQVVSTRIIDYDRPSSQGVRMIQEVYLESGFEEAAVVRRQRDQRCAQLQAEGWECRREDLYTVDGRRVFVVIAEPLTAEAEPVAARSTESSSPRLRPTRPDRSASPVQDAASSSTHLIRRVARYERR